MLLGLQNVTFEFGARTIVEDATWHIQPGERIGLIGYNGTGKSTLLKVLTGEYTPAKGTVEKGRETTIGFLNQDLLGFETNESILEVAIAKIKNIFLLDTQYRMRQAIAGFSGQYFYNGLLQTAVHLVNTGTHITFIDTAGSGFNEMHGSDGISLQNKGELQLVQKLFETASLDPVRTALISPYSGQVAAAKELLPKQVRISTIDRA